VVRHNKEVLAKVCAEEEWPVTEANSESGQGQG